MDRFDVGVLIAGAFAIVVVVIAAGADQIAAL